MYAPSSANVTRDFCIQYIYRQPLCCNWMFWLHENSLVSFKQIQCSNKLTFTFTAHPTSWNLGFNPPHTQYHCWQRKSLKYCNLLVACTGSTLWCYKYALSWTWYGLLITKHLWKRGNCPIRQTATDWFLEARSVTAVGSWKYRW